MRTFIFILVIAAYFCLDIYVYNAIKGLWQDSSIGWRRTFIILFWTLSILPIMSILLYSQFDNEKWKAIRSFVLSGFFMILFGKILAALFLLIDDFRRVVAWFIELFPGDQTFDKSRSDFIRKASIGAAALPVAAMGFGIVSGAHDYRIRRRTLTFPNLPKQFDGLRVAQLSDIHTGSFFSKTAVQGGVDMLNNERPDVVFFTGDFVNNQSEEAKPYLDIFKKVKSELGTFSVMGNHDYGDYYQWPSLKEKQQDVKNLHDMHSYMGWNILLNENRTLNVDGEEIAILGVENWGNGRFSKYGDLAKTYQGTADKPFNPELSLENLSWCEWPVKMP